MSSIHVMIVDDDLEDRFFLKSAFNSQRSASHFTEIEDGVHALDYFDEAAANPLPDVIFLDLYMPREDGYQTLIALKAHARAREIPVMIVSAAISHDIMARCTEAGCARFYNKPMSLEEYGQLAKDTIGYLQPTA